MAKQNVNEVEELDELENGLLDTQDEGLDLTMPDEDEPDESAEEKRSESKPEAKAKPEYDKQQQQLDQERANVKRLKGQMDSLAVAHTTVQQQLEASAKELAELKTAIQEKKAEAKKLDPESMTAQDIATALEEQQARFNELAAENAELKAGLKTIREQQEKAAQQDAQLTLQDRILTKVERTLARTLGGNWEQHRVEALRMADGLVERGEIDQPKTVDEGEDLMLDCYRKVQEASKKPDKPNGKTRVRSDDGRGGVSPGNDIQAGSLNSVLDQLRKKPSAWKTR